MTTVYTDCPLRLGQAEEFAAIQDFFRQAKFDDATLCQALGICDMTEFGKASWPDVQLDLLSAALKWCINIFARGLQMDEEVSRSICGEKVLASLFSVGLLRHAQKNPANILSPVWVYPVDGFIMASDRREDPEGDPFNPPADVVFPAIYPGTLRFIKLLPAPHGGDALDHCGGSGIGALRLARTARTAVTADLTERSAFFAEFNSRLNGLKIESLCGDLYLPVAGRKFDLITAHPPFVPATGTTMVYRDGGETGETVTRRIIEELPKYLRPGGTAMILCVACDAEKKNFEVRVQEWLGEAGNEFDIVFGLEKILAVEEVVDSMRKRGQQIDEEAAVQLTNRLRAAGTRQFVYGAIFLRRYEERVGANPVRVRMTTKAAAVDFQRLLAWRHFSRRPDFSQWLAASFPHLAAGLLLTARHIVQEGDLVPVDFVFSIEAGFQTALKPDAWVVPLVARLNGKKSVREVFSEAQGRDELPAGFTLDAFMGLIQKMIELGLLEVEFPSGINSSASSLQ